MTMRYTKIPPPVNLAPQRVPVRRVDPGEEQEMVVVTPQVTLADLMSYVLYTSEQAKVIPILRVIKGILKRVVDGAKDGYFGLNESEHNLVLSITESTEKPPEYQHSFVAPSGDVIRFTDPVLNAVLMPLYDALANATTEPPEMPEQDDESEPQAPEVEGS